MKGWRGHFRGFLNQRLPFFPLVMSAIVGIVGDTIFPFPGFLSLLVSLLALGLAIFLAGKHAGVAFVSVLVGTVFAFAALNAWQGRESAAARFAAAWSGPAVVDLEARVAEMPKVYENGRSSFPATVTKIGIAGESAHGSFPIQVDWRGDPPGYGDLVRIWGSLTAFEPPRNPGAFDRGEWMQRRGIHSRVRVGAPSDASIEAPFAGWNLKSLALAAAQKMRETLTAGLDPESREAHLIIAMTLGDASPFSESLNEAFRATGTLHLFSVSGLHVGMLAMLLWLVLSALGVSAKGRAFVIIPLLFFYALITGWKPASVRAAAMASFVLAGLILNRPPAVVNSLMAAAFFLLLANTGELLNPGFQMSFLVVFALILLSIPLAEAIKRPLEVDPFIPKRIFHPKEKLRDWFARKGAPFGAVILAAWIGSLLLTYAYFHLVSFAAIPANSVCVPLSFCVMALAMMSLASGVVSTALAALFNNSNWLFAGVILGAVEFLAALPGAYVYVGKPVLPPPIATLTAFDFAGGGALGVQSGSGFSLIDSGPLMEHEWTLVPFLRSQGVNRLKALILTHGDAGHIGSAQSLLAPFDPEIVMESGLPDRSTTRRALQEALAIYPTTHRNLLAGDWFALSNQVRVQCLYPPENLTSDVADDKALVLLMHIGPWRVLLLSDAGPLTIHWLLENARESLKCDVLIKGNHRSGISPPPDLWSAATPSAVIASSRDFPGSERLAEEMIRDLDRADIPLFRQDETGAVIIQVHEAEMQIRSFLTPQELLLKN
ncbi:MAG: ComEC/Rec2 family competence protein [Terrimicrobiaceae bacterium]